MMSAAAPDPLAALRRAPGIIRLHGHRGARAVMPENTMAGFAFALEAGLKAIEFDVLFSAEGVPVLHHDFHLSPHSVRDAQGNWIEGPGPLVHALPLEELRRYNVGGLRDDTLYGARFPDQVFLDHATIPTLDELAALLARPEHGDVWMNLEIKSSPHLPEATPPIPDLVAATLEVLERHGLRRRCLLQCFNWHVLDEIARQDPSMPRSFLSARASTDSSDEDNIYPGSPWLAGHAPDAHGNSLPRTVAAAGGQVWSPYHRDLSRAELAEARELGLLVNVWTVNEPRDLDRMIAMGVDGIITDTPGRAQRRMLSHGLHWA